MKRHRVIITGEAEEKAREHLLQHMEKLQEDICFALWNPSTGEETQGAIIEEIILPKKGERKLHGCVTAKADYIARATLEAVSKGKGLAMMHSHPSKGWQGLSYVDAETEGDNIIWTAGTTGLPFIGMTIGIDGYWSARFWNKPKAGRKSKPNWCQVVQTTGAKNGKLHFNPRTCPPPTRRRELMRTYDTWGEKAQHSIARAKVCIIGIGSVGSLVTECMARIGVQDITLIDPDTIEAHNLDRLIYSGKRNIGQKKVKTTKRWLRRSCTAKKPKIKAVALPIQKAYKHAIDCNIIFSCVDRPVARDIINHIATAHMIPVIDAGITVSPNERTEELTAAKWIAQLITPGRQCLMCTEKYTSALLGVELDGSLERTSYVTSLPKGNQLRNENVFPFSLSAAALQANMMIRYLAAPEWWSEAARETYQLSIGVTEKENEDCHPNCRFNAIRGTGDKTKPRWTK